MFILQKAYSKEVTHSLRFGASKEIQTDFGTNFSAAKETLEAEQIMNKYVNISGAKERWNKFDSKKP